MKIAVYAICKNESKFINRWYNSMKEADGIYVLDTGSTDNSVELLKSLNVNVVSKNISPWRFDVARNLSLQLVPEDYDLCVCTDIDEIFNEGWRKIIEDNYKPGTTRIKYTYNWFIENNIPSEFVSLESLDGLKETIITLGEKFEKIDRDLKRPEVIKKIINYK